MKRFFLVMPFAVTWLGTATGVTALSPDEQVAHLTERAEAAEVRHDFKTARTLLTLATRTSPDDDALQEALAQLDLRRFGASMKLAAESKAAGRLSTALVAFAEANSADPSDPDANAGVKEMVKRLMLTDPLKVPIQGFEWSGGPAYLAIEALQEATVKSSKGAAWLHIRMPPNHLAQQSVTVPPADESRTVRRILGMIFDQMNYRGQDFAFEGPGNYATLVPFAGFRPISSLKWPELPKSVPAPPPATPSIARTRLEPMEWKANAGHSTEAFFVAIAGETLVLKKAPGGGELRIAMSSLTPESVAQAERCDIDPKEILIHYNFNDREGNQVTDHSGNNRHGTLTGFGNTAVGGGNFEGSSGWSDNGALQFDGRNTSVSMPISTGDLIGKCFTLEAIVRHDATATRHRQIIGTSCRDYSSPGNVQLFKAPAGWGNGGDSSIGWRINGLVLDTPPAAQDTAINDGNYHHVALVRDFRAGTVHVYLDHEFLSETKVSGDIDGSNPMVIGSAYNRQECWKGLISEARITTLALPVSRFLASPGGLNLRAPEAPASPADPEPIADHSMRDLIVGTMWHKTTGGDTHRRFSANGRFVSRAHPHDTYRITGRREITLIFGGNTFIRCQMNEDCTELTELDGQRHTWKREMIENE